MSVFYSCKFLEREIYAAAVIENKKVPLKEGTMNRRVGG